MQLAANFAVVSEKHTDLSDIVFNNLQACAYFNLVG